MNFTSATATKEDAVLEQDLMTSGPARPALSMVPSPATGMKQPRRPFRLRAYLPNAYLSRPRARRAGSYA